MSAEDTPYVPLTSDNAALVLVDHQVGLLSGVRDIPLAELKNKTQRVPVASAALDNRRDAFAAKPSRAIFFLWACQWNVDHHQYTALPFGGDTRFTVLRRET